MPPERRLEATAGERRLRAAATALAGLPALALLLTERWFFGDLAGFPFDDTWIHLEFARNLAAGAGLSYRGGHLVAGSTAPLWTAGLAALALLPGPLTAWCQLSGLAAQLLVLLATWRLGRRLDLSPGLAALAVLLVGWTDWMVFAAVSGMEIGLAAALVLCALARRIDERRDRTLPPLSFLLVALAALARPEALLLLPLAAFDTAFTGPARSAPAALRRELVGYGVAAVVLAPVALAYVAMSGSPFPTTLAAKSFGPASGVPRLRDVVRVVDFLLSSQTIPTLLAGAGVLVLLGRRRREDSPGLLLPVWVIALPLALSALAPKAQGLNLGSLGRYVHPLLPCVVLLGIVGLEPLVAGAGRARGRGGGAARAVGVALLLALPIVQTARVFPLYLQARSNVDATDVAAARWLAEHASPAALVAAIDIGAVGYLRPNPIVDLGAIVDPDLTRYLRSRVLAGGSDWHRAVLEWLGERRPDYVLSYPNWFPELEAEPRRFPVLARFRIRDNIAMAGPELVVYATPWTRTFRKDSPP